MEVGGGSSTGPGGGDCSSCSGTLSSTYTPGCSPLSSSCSFHPPGILSALELDAETRAKKLGHIKRLVEEFRDAAAGGSALERWFSEMDIAWVLRLGVGVGDDDASAGAGSILASHSQPLQRLARCWILGLREIKDSTFVYMDGLCCNEEDAESTSEPPPPAAAALSELSRFVQSTLLKMLPFVDAIAAHIPSCNCSSEQHGGTVSLQSPATTTAAATRLQALVDVRDALSTASEEIQFWPSFFSLYHVESAGIIDEISDLLSSKLGKLDKAIWDTMDGIRTGLMGGTGKDDSASASPDVHKLTRSVISCINLLDTNYVLLSRIAYEAAQLGSYLPEILGVAPLTSLMTEMFSRLEEKLVSMSHSWFQSQCDSLGILFLINNSHFIWQQLHPMFDMAFPMAVLNRKIDDYMQSYLQVSWGPVLSCLYYDPGPLRRGSYSSALPLFEFEFHKVYRAQRFWKVPDPELRGRLRKAITNKVTSGLKKFLEDKNVTTPRITPQELEDMLQELFEG